MILSLLPLGTGSPLARACGGSEDPKADRDGDGVPDVMDRCVDRVGPLANLGCPDRDEDRDGVVDRLDACPTVSGSAAARGCPDESTPISPTSQALVQAAAPAAGPAVPGGGAGVAGAGSPTDGLASLRGGRFEWPEPIAFDRDRDTLTERGQLEVAATARAILLHPELRQLTIEGHVDEPGNSAAHARELSERRAEAVKRALVQLGVPASKLRTRGFGYSKLLDRSETPAAQKKNNRIEIVVTE